MRSYAPYGLLDALHGYKMRRPWRRPRLDRESTSTRVVQTSAVFAQFQSRDLCPMHLVRPIGKTQGPVMSVHGRNREILTNPTAAMRLD